MSEGNSARYLSRQIATQRQMTYGGVGKVEGWGDERWNQNKTENYEAQNQDERGEENSCINYLYVMLLTTNYFSYVSTVYLSPRISIDPRTYKQ